MTENKQTHRPHQKLIKDTLVITLSNVFLAFKGIILVPVITKLLGTNDYGIWTQISVTLSFVVPIIMLGLPNALVRFLAGEKDRDEIKDGIYSSLTLIFIISGILSALLFIFPTPLATFFATGSNIVRILAITITIECINQIILSVFLSFRQMSGYSFFTIFQTLGEIMLVILAVKLGFGLLGAIGALLASRVIITVFGGAYVLSNYRMKKPKFLKLKEHLKFSLPITLNSVSWWVLQSSDRYLINIFLGIKPVGIYSAAYGIGVAVPAMISSIFDLVLPPTLAKHYDEGNIDMVRAILSHSLKYFLFLALPVVFQLWALAKPTLAIFSNQEIVASGAVIIPIVAISMIFLGISRICNQVLSLKKRTGIIGAIWLVAACTNILLNILLIPKIGIMGAAYSTAISFALLMGLSIYYSIKHLTFHVEIIVILKSLVASVIVASIALWISPSGFVATFLTAIAGMFAYILILMLVKAFTPKEIAIFVESLRISRKGAIDL
jgi:O-antigen/teichoic acid export membrane protein